MPGRGADWCSECSCCWADRSGSEIVQDGAERAGAPERAEGSRYGAERRGKETGTRSRPSLHFDSEGDRQTTSFIEISLEAGILLGSKGEIKLGVRVLYPIKIDFSC